MSNPTPSQTGKLLIRGSIVILSIVAVFIAVVAYLTARENTEFLEKGIRKKASILNKTENITRRTKRANKSEYFFKVAIFANANSIEKKTVKPKSNSVSDKIDAMFEEIKTQPLGDFIMKDVRVSSTLFANKKVGEIITVVYLKEDPENFKILEDLE